jgi:hypothetical protein
VKNGDAGTAPLQHGIRQSALRFSFPKGWLRYAYAPYQNIGHPIV